jgi:hypothetical protein
LALFATGEGLFCRSRKGRSSSRPAYQARNGRASINGCGKEFATERIVLIALCGLLVMQSLEKAIQVLGRDVSWTLLRPVLL